MDFDYTKGIPSIEDVAKVSQPMRWFWLIADTDGTF
jgi:hypothetical protein